MRPQTQRLGLRLGIVAGANSSAMACRGAAMDTWCHYFCNNKKYATKKE